MTGELATGDHLTGAAIALLGVSAFFSMVSGVITGVMLLRVTRRTDREAERDRLLTRIEGDVRSLTEGMSAGAREGFRAVNGRLNVVEDELGQQREQLTEVRADLRALDRTVEGHIRTASWQAHPPPGYPPAPA